MKASTCSRQSSLLSLVNSSTLEAVGQSVPFEISDMVGREEEE